MPMLSILIIQLNMLLNYQAFKVTEAWECTFKQQTHVLLMCQWSSLSIPTPVQRWWTPAPTSMTTAPSRLMSMLAKLLMLRLAAVLTSAESKKQQKRYLKVAPGTWSNGCQQAVPIGSPLMTISLGQLLLALMAIDLKSGQSNLISRSSPTSCSCMMTITRSWTRHSWILALPLDFRLHMVKMIKCKVTFWSQPITQVHQKQVCTLDLKSLQILK